MKPVKLTILTTLFTMLLIPALGRNAWSVTDQEFAVILNLSGKQRMLTQKMSKESFLIAKGINVEGNKESLFKTATLFDKTLKGLIAGDADLGLVASGKPKIVKQLKKVKTLWTGFRRYIEAVLGGDTSPEILGKIAAENLPLLKNMNRCVKMFENAAKVTGGSTMKPGMAVVINLAGKQRMLTQKMTKELLLVALAIDGDKNRLNLKKTASLFDRTLKGLLDGDPDLELPGTRDADIRNQLGTVGSLWQSYKPLLDKVVASSSATIPTADIESAAKLNLPLLSEMNTAVKMFEQSVK